MLDMRHHNETRVPYRTVYRLSLYARALQRLCERGAKTVSSQALALSAGVKADQVRKDLTQVGHLGRPGLGYPASELLEHLQGVLGTTRLRPVVLLGAGRLGKALLAYPGFNKEGFEIVAAFDADSRQCGRFPTTSGHVDILPIDKLEQVLRDNSVRLAILTVPGESAQAVANRLVANGVRGILNFSPVLLQVPEDVTVNNVNLALELEQLNYFTEDGPSRQKNEANVPRGRSSARKPTNKRRT